MAKYVLFAVITIIIAQVQPREIPLVMTKLGPTYDELVYILQSRHGLTGNKPKPKHLTPCARAILGCCNNKVMNENCSERLKCGAYFFDENPCEDKFILDALEAAKQFYDQFNAVVAA